jgi:hypothetical protein
MPFKSDTFYGRVKLGDFTLTVPQLIELLEQEGSFPVPKSHFEKVMTDPQAYYRKMLKV